MNPQKKLDMVKSKLFNELLKLFDTLTFFDSDLLRNYVAEYLQINQKAIAQLHGLIETFFLSYCGRGNFEALERSVIEKSTDGFLNTVLDLGPERFAEISNIAEKVLELKKTIVEFSYNEFDDKLLIYFDCLMKNINSNLLMLKNLFTVINDQDDVQNFINDYMDWEKFYSLPIDNNLYE